jgi:predicted lipoprotein
MKRPFAWFIAVIALAGWCRLFPPFHVVPLERARQQKAAATFDPAQFAEKFWTDQLLPATDRAARVDVLLPAIGRDAAAARKQFSRSLGMSESYTYFLSGQGRVLTVSPGEIALAVTDGALTPEVSLQTGLVFGNAVRDGTGLLNVNDYPNSQDFNGISEALNRLIETRVLPGLREQARVGATIRFTGCAEVNDESTDLKPLRVVPVRVEVETAPRSGPP